MESTVSALAGGPCVECGGPGMLSPRKDKSRSGWFVYVEFRCTCSYISIVL